MLRSQVRTLQPAQRMPRRAAVPRAQHRAVRPPHCAALQASSRQPPPSPQPLITALHHHPAPPPPHSLTGTWRWRAPCTTPCSPQRSSSPPQTAGSRQGQKSLTEHPSVTAGRASMCSERNSQAAVCHPTRGSGGCQPPPAPASWRAAPAPHLAVQGEQQALHQGQGPLVGGRQHRQVNRLLHVLVKVLQYTGQYNRAVGQQSGWGTAGLPCQWPSQNTCRHPAVQHGSTAGQYP
jgi:hypothetical protein